MSLQPFNWSVVILGYWNLAILAPGRIADKIFRLEKGTKVPVMVPVDGNVPCQVEHPDRDIKVSAHPNRLMFELIKMNYDALKHAMDCAIEALTWLPETPVWAAGFNVNARTDKPSTEMVSYYAHKIDGMFADLGYEVTNYSLGRSLQYGDGMFNINIRGTSNNFEFLCNFHRESRNNEDLIEWLRTPIEQIEEKVTQVLQKFGLKIEDTNHDNSE